MHAGDRIAGRFLLEGRAGSGGMGDVYRARDEATGAIVALKLVRGGASAQRFRREAEILAGLEHASIVRYVAHGLDPSYLAMEWLDGEDLTARLMRGAVTAREAVDLVRRVADGLATAHAAGVVHRDLKPSNVFLRAARIDAPVIIDFGVARSSEAPTTGELVGTPAYMAPEQARCEPTIDARADVFALGCVLFECIAGHPAFRGANGVAVLAKVLLDQPPSLSVTGASDVLAGLVARMLAKSPKDRPADAREVADLLARLDQLDAAPMRRSAITRIETRILSVLLIARSPSSTPLPDEAVRLCERGGRTLDRLADGSILVTVWGSGAPSDRAAEAARLAIALRGLAGDRPLSLATGRARLGADTPVGEVVDRAAAHAAEPGAIAIDEATAALLRDRFEIQEQGGSFALLAERRDLTPGRTLLGQRTPFLGREREMATLQALYLEVVEESVARAAVVTGGPGVGKSRLRAELCDALATEARPPKIWIARGEPLTAGASFGLAGQLVRRALELRDGEPIDAQRAAIVRAAAALGPSVEAVAPFLGELAGAPFDDASSVQLSAARADPRLMGDQLRRSFEELVAASATKERPLVLVLEDLHWSDPATINLLDATLRRSRDAPLFVVAIARPEIAIHYPTLWLARGAHHVRLGAISARAAERIARTILGAAATAEAIASILARFDGNAFYLEELVRAVALGRDDLPDTVLAMVEARLERLDADARHCLRAASVFGRAFAMEGLEAVAGHEPGTREMVERLVADEILVRTQAGSLAFRHALICDGAYAMLTDGDRALGHRLAGEWLEANGEREPMVLAEHFERGGEALRAAHHVTRAAALALEGNDLERAIERTERAIALGATGELLGQARVIEAEASSWSGQYARGESAASEALRCFKPGSATWYRAAQLRLTCLSNLARFDDVRELASDLQSEASLPGSERARRMALAWLAYSSCFTGQTGAAAALLERLGPATGDPMADAAVLNARMILAHVEGDLGRAIEHAMAARDRYIEVGDRRHLCAQLDNIGFTLVALGDAGAAEITLRRAIEEAERVGLEPIARSAKSNLGLALLRMGKLAEAERLEREAIEGALAHEQFRMAGAAQTYLALVLLAAGRLDEAESNARGAEERLASAPGQRPLAVAVVARCLLARGDLARAVEVATRAMDELVRAGGVDDGDAFIRLTHAEVLAIVHDARAPAAIVAARDRVLANADKITAPLLRERFLRDNPDHAQTLALAARLSA
jgi:tetratricopeptide (TPR) repeat protein